MVTLLRAQVENCDNEVFHVDLSALHVDLLISSTMVKSAASLELAFSLTLCMDLALLLSIKSHPS